jgi:uncharacterized protein YdeI (YjbR/CyaY-like superfamily)
MTPYHLPITNFDLPMPDLPLLPFKTPRAFAAWLKRNHARSPGLWLKLAKQGAHPSISYAEALEEALCWGWIDGQKKAFDDAWWLQKFTPRGPRSIWSQINRDKALALSAAGRMQPPGLAAIAAAQKSGRWEAAYAGQRTAALPADFQAELDRRPHAKAFYATLNSVNRYAITFRLGSAKKPETRARRTQQFLEMLEKGEKLIP